MNVDVETRDALRFLQAAEVAEELSRADFKQESFLESLAIVFRVAAFGRTDDLQESLAMLARELVPMVTSAQHSAKCDSTLCSPACQVRLVRESRI